jgi:glycosyltransferase involved in cell wall biosynthesis
MTALVIAPQPFFTPRGTPFSVYYRTLVLAQQGVSIDLLTYGEGQDVEIPGVRIIRIPRFAMFGPVRIGPSWLKAFLDCFLIVWTVGLLLKNRYDFVHAHEESVFWCRFLKPVFRFRLVYDMHSRLPKQLTAFEFTRSKALIGLFHRLERASLQSADAVVTISPDLEQHVIAEGTAPDRHLLIENSLFDDVHVSSPPQVTAPEPADCTALDEALEGERPVVAYAGTFEVYQGLDLLICAFVHVIANRPDARLLLIGGTRAQVDQKKRLAENVGVAGACVFAGTVEKRRATELIRRADVLVSPRMEGTSTPLKIYEQLATGKPMVATRVSAHTQVLNDEVCILVNLDPESLAQGILEALNNGSASVQATNAARLYQSAYSRGAYEAKVRRLLEILPDATSR